MKRQTTKNLMLSALFAALLCVGAFIRIPVPPTSISLQTLFAVLAGLLLGPKYGAVSALVYMLLGLVGLPVFTGGGGLTYVLTPLFGYIPGFVLGALTAGALARKRETPDFWWLLMSAAAGMLVINAAGVAYFFALGFLYLGQAAMLELTPAFLASSLLTLPADVVKALLAALLSVRLIPAIKKIGQ